MGAPERAEAGADGPAGAGALRPQAVLLTFFGAYLLGRGAQVATSSVLEVLGRAGVSEPAARSALSRMARRGLLRRERRGRQVYLGLTPRTREILGDGDERVWRTDAVNRQWDGSWTLLGFSLPDSWQRQRHELRSRLLWAGFGPLQGGLWVAPSGADVTVVAGGPEVTPPIRGFSARAPPPAGLGELGGGAWGLAPAAARYRGFLERWEAPGHRPRLPDSLAQQLALQTDWLQVIRRDPRLPVQHLPEGWPAE